MPRPLYKAFLLWTRTLHIYLTMLVLVLVIFFSFTGFIMNHPEWCNIDEAVMHDTAATLPARRWPPIALRDHKLNLVEFLRSHQNACGEMTSFGRTGRRHARAVHRPWPKN